MTHENVTDTEGGGYGRGIPHHNARLTEVGPGTPGGEYLRRYWQPVAVASEIGSRPKEIRILGERLVVFRDGTGRPGLLHARCAHRGSSLYYGRIEKEGIRCCYHGWLFDTEGRCLDQPCEVDGGAQRHKVRQPWYPVEERYGLLFAYMGPPARKPKVPRFDVFEKPGPGEQVFAFSDVGTAAYSDSAVKEPAIPYNWFQWWENSVDHYHVWILHSTFSIPQFDAALQVRPDIHFTHTDTGVAYHAVREVEGRRVDRVGEGILPNMMSIAGDDLSRNAGPARRISWGVPVDDTSFLVFTASVGTEVNERMAALVMTPDGKTWSQMSEAEHQAYPGDFEAQASQGPITLHSTEHLVGSDEGVMILRRLTLKQIAAVRDGKDPAGVAFTDENALLHVSAGNYWL